MGKALSIQAHPDKELAKWLHLQNPILYPDSNHKPEVAIALTRFEALCGFRPIEQIKMDIKTIPEIFKNPSSLSPNPSLKEIFKEFIDYEGSIDIILKRLIDNGHALSELIQRLKEQYPNDPTVLIPLLLNYVILESGDAIFLPPNEPHAYLFGDCIECMALSDNVVRAGLTPKPKDKQTLCKMLTFNPMLNIGLKADFKGRYKNSFIEEFAVKRIEKKGENIESANNNRINNSDQTESLEKSKCPSIVICIEGEGTISGAGSEKTIKAGQVYLLTQNVDFLFKGRGLLFQAYKPSF